MKNLEEDCRKLLAELINGDIVDIDTSGFVNKMKKNKVKQVHKYQITPPKTEGGRWSTYYKNDGMKERRKVTSTTEDGLYAKLYQVYFEPNHYTLAVVFEQWIDKRRRQNLSPRTLNRDRQRWDRYFSSRSLAGKKIHTITTEQLEDTVHGLISEFNMREKELKAVLGILRGCMKHSVKTGLIVKNPMDSIEINRLACRPAASRHDRSRIYLVSEQQTMFREITRELIEQPNNTDALAIQIEFKLGLRIGELAALKFSDIDIESMTIHIQRMESIDEEGHVIVVEHLKKKSRESNRFLPIGDYELGIFEQIRKINEANGYWDDDFIFVDENGRTHIRAIDNRIRKLCRRGGIPEKSSHDIRRTVASVMHKNGVSVEQIRFYMGHNNVNTTWGYIYDIDTEEETSRIIRNALTGLNIA